MTYLLNQLPNEALNLISNSSSVDNFKCSWPYNINVRQDRTIDSYIEKLLKVKFPEPIAQYAAVELHWQFLQVYRILNAAISSVKISLHDKTKLQLLRTRLEVDSEISYLLEAVRVMHPAVICSGHGGWNTNEDLITVAEGQKIFFYAGAGATLTEELGINIENGNMRPSAVAVLDKQTRDIIPLPSDETYPYCIEGNKFSKPIANFTLTGDPARIIEWGTGKILFQKNEISLKKICDFFPRHEIHWAACNSLLNEASNKPIGPLRHLRWMKLSHTDKNKKSYNKQTSIKITDTKNSFFEQLKMKNESINSQSKPKTLSSYSYQP